MPPPPTRPRAQLPRLPLPLLQLLPQRPWPCRTPLLPPCQLLLLMLLEPLLQQQQQQ